MRQLRVSLLYLVLLSLWFCLLYGTSDWLAASVPYRIPMKQPSWPFRPGWAPVYLSLNLLLVVAFVASKRKAELFTSLTLQTLAACPLFVVLPLQPIELPKRPDSWWFTVADTVNLHLNYLPSLHVGFALTAAYFLGRPLTALWAGAIALSTVFTYQHYPVDVVAGALLAGIAIWLVQGRGRVLAICLGELVRCTARHRRYGLISVALLAALLLHPRAGRRALLGFCYLQRVDDLLDGHLACDGEPEDLAREQVKKWRGSSFESDDLDLMGRNLQKALPETEKIVSIIEEMILDRRRVREKRLLSEQELKEHLERTFALSLDLMLAASEAEITSADAPALTSLLGWCSVVRDLEEDLSLGLVNVPKEVVRSGTVEQWFESELHLAKMTYSKADEQLHELEGKSGLRLLTLFHRSVQKYLKKHSPNRAAQLVSRSSRP